MVLSFGKVTKAAWVVLLTASIIVETMPNPNVRPFYFYCYAALKVLCFIAVGYLTPLALSRFNSLTRGIMLALSTAICTELVQAMLPGSHHFHWYELLAKPILVAVGAAFALEARYDEQISIGSLHFPIHVRPQYEYL
jgi:hypothetical protein